MSWIWERAHAVQAYNVSDAYYNKQLAGNGLQTTDVNNGTMSVKLGNGLYFDTNNAVAVSGGGGTTYTAGDHIDISNNVISVSGTGELIAGENITIAASGNDYVISSVGGGSGNIFEVIHGTTTFSDINTAFNDGKTLLFVHYPSSYDSYGTFTGTLVAKDTNTYVFGGFTDGYSTSNTTTYVEYTISQWTGWSNTPRAQRSFNMQADWSQTNSNSGDYIKNKPTIHTYTGANGINISNDVVSLDNPISLVPGNNIEISVSGVSAIISSTGGGGGSYTAGNGIDINNSVISVDATETASAVSGLIHYAPYNVREFTSTNTALFDEVYAKYQSESQGGNFVPVFYSDCTGFIDYLTSNTSIHMVVFRIKNSGRITKINITWNKGSNYSVGAASNYYYNRQVAGSGIQTTDASDGTMSAKLGNGLQFDANQAIEINIGDISSVQMVTALPQNPSSAVLYLIPES